MKKTAFIADISLLLVALIWGVTFVIVQNALAFLEPFSFNGFRFLIAAFLLGGWLILFKRKQLQHLNKKALFSGILIGIWLFIGYAFQTLGLLYTSSSKAGFITGLSVILVPLIAFLFIKVKIGRKAVIGVSIATFGLYLLAMTDAVSLNQGDAYVFICAFGFALHIIFTGKYANKYPALLLTVIQITTVAVLSIFFAFLLEDLHSAINPEILFSKEVAAGLIITSVFATALAFFAQTHYQQFTTPTRVALIFAMEPVFAAITGFIWANDRLSYSAALGCLFIFAGMVFAEMPDKKLRKATAA
ncbi:DMT family transporter [Cytobacillus purgationiresistens]|uniref:Drug/metabolite transporter (DMT)-like permease n=1 Tax=Cytobacillus purgationiresistens TaxID=863449 RepID=A0ABU0AMR6_9BACI|nr:DMT family transporter [Cytobacillus purgationiresistens]MDQ0272046.1 drug/metabolite transporter (DMT)-like permease [Cytobacillus purgationiresistens]